MIRVMTIFGARPEAIEAGTSKLVGTDSEAIFAETQRLLDNKKEYGQMARVVNPCGDGKVAARIISVKKVGSLRGEMEAIHSRMFGNIG